MPPFFTETGWGGRSISGGSGCSGVSEGSWAGLAGSGGFIKHHRHDQFTFIKKMDDRIRLGKYRENSYLRDTI